MNTKRSPAAPNGGYLKSIWKRPRWEGSFAS